MVVIDKNTGKCYENLSQNDVANLIVVNRSTVHRWQKKYRVKDTDKWVIYFYAMKK